MENLPVEIENDGIRIWYGTEDAPAPGGVVSVPKTKEIEIIIGVSPASSNNRVEVNYSINDGQPAIVKASYLPKVGVKNVQYFRAYFKGIKPGDKVQYFVRCHTSKGIVPPKGKEQWVTFSLPIQGRIHPQANQPISTYVSDTSSEGPEEKPTRTQPDAQSSSEPPKREQQQPPAKPEEEDPCAPKPLPEENLPAEREFWVYGRVTVAGKPMHCVRVSAYDKDMRSEQFLGDAQTDKAGEYSIQYSSSQFRRAEKERADLKLRAYYEDDYSAETDVIFNADEKHRVDLELQPIERQPAAETEKITLTEYEQYISELEPLMEGIPFQDLTAEDIAFLTKETTLEKQYIEFLKWSFQIAMDSSIPEAAFYGWYRRGIQFEELRDLLSYRISRLIKELEIAIGDHIIPELDLIGVKESLRSLRFELGKLIRYNFEGQIVEQDSKLPLDDFIVVAYDHEAEEPEDRTIGEVKSDTRGMFRFVLSIPADTNEGYIKKVSLEIKNEAGELALETELEVDPSKEIVHKIEIDLETLPDNSTVIDEKMAAPGLLRHLREAGINTINDARKKPEVIDKLQETYPEDAQVKNIVSHVSWSILLDDHDVRQKLIDKGFPSIFDATATSKISFIEKMRDELEEVEAAQLYLKAELVKWRVYDKANEARLKYANGKEPPEFEVGDIPPFKEILLADSYCTCKECESAVSPMAYLVDLLKWILKNVKWGGVIAPDFDLKVRDLEETFYQPFGSLPASCDAMNKEYRQVRISVDILRRFLLKNTEGVDTTVGRRVAFRNALNEYNQNVYVSLLNRMGLSYEEFRSKLASIEAIAEVDYDNPEYQSLAERAGIGIEHLLDLYIPRSSNLSSQLFEIFGYFRLDDPFEANQAPRLLEWQFTELKKIWAGQDRAFAPYGFDRTLPIIDPTIIISGYFRYFSELESADSLEEADVPESSISAFQLFQNRRAELTSHQNGLLSQVESSTLETVISERLGGISFSDLEELSRQIENSAEAGVALEALADIPIPVEHFRRLMELAGGDRTSDDLLEITHILTYLHKIQLYPNWVQQEQELIELNGRTRPQVLQDSATFWIPATTVDPTPWLARPEDIEAWHHAYHEFNSQPLIDPDQLDVNDFKIDLESSEDNPALEIWESRVQWREERVETIMEAISSVGLPSQKLSEAFAASTIEISPSEIEALNNRLESGEDISTHLTHLRIRNDMFRFLVELNTSVSEGRDVLNSRWEDLAHILVQIEKSHLYGCWKFEEHSENIVLSDELFEINIAPSESPDRWLTDEAAYFEWQGTLDARIEQRTAQRDSLKSSLEAAEEQFLPGLRETYIREIADIPGMPTAARNPSWYQSRLFINLKSSGCQKTTRVSEAILALQNFVLSIHNNSIKQVKVEEGPRFFNFSIVSEHFEKEWEWLGSYANWRSAMFVHYYPENICQPQLQRKDFHSHGFKKLLGDINRNLTPDHACKLIKRYGAFFDRIKKLRVQATCYARTIIKDSNGCYIKTPTAKYVFLFALAEGTGKVYWCNFKDNVTYDNLIWKPIRGLNRNEYVVEIIAATPYPRNEKHIALFVKTREGNKQKLKVIFYDLKNGGWNGRKEVGLPDSMTNSFQVVAEERRNSFHKKLSLVILSNDGELYVKIYRLDNKSWENDDWSVAIYSTGGMEIEKLGTIFRLSREGKSQHFIICQFRGPGNSKKIKICNYTLKSTWYRVVQGEYLYSHLKKDEVSSDDKTKIRLFFLADNTVKSLQVSLDLDRFQEQRVYNKEEVTGPVLNFNQLKDKINQALGINLDSLQYFFSFESSDFLPAITQYETYFLPKEVMDIFYEWLESGGEYHIIESLGDFLSMTYSDLLARLQISFDGDFWEDRGEYNLTENDYFWMHRRWAKQMFKAKLLARFLSIGISKISLYIDSQEDNSTKSKYQLINQFLRKNVSTPVYTGIVGSVVMENLRQDGPHTNIPIADNVKIADFDLKDVLSFLLWKKLIISVSPYQWVTEIEITNIFGYSVASNFEVSISKSVVQLDYFSIFLLDLSPNIGRTSRCYDYPLWFPKSSFLPLENTYDTQLEGDYFIIESSSNKETYFANLPSEDEKLTLVKQLSFYHNRDGVKPYLELMGPTSKGMESFDIKSYYSSAFESSKSNIRLMQEAFRGVPELIALYLQKNGYYEDALNFFRKIYDYTKQGSLRKNDYWLEYESTGDFELNFERNDNWWKDPLNPHRVASKRKGTYTRHILLLIVRCFIEYADSEFAKDNVESNEKARQLYEQALELLKAEELDFDPKGCGVYWEEETLRERATKMRMVISKVNEPHALRELNDVVLQATNQGVSEVQKIERVKEAYKKATSLNREQPKPLKDIIDSDSEKFKKLERYFFKDALNQRTLKKTTQRRANHYKAELISVARQTVYELKDIDDSEQNLVVQVQKPRQPGNIAILDGSIDPDGRSKLQIANVDTGEDSPSSILGRQSFEFCMPQNPVLKSLYDTATNNLDKLNNCMNIAGMKRDIEPYAAPTDTETGMPFVGSEGQLISRSRFYINQKPTQYRYPVLIERAKQLAQLANQVEQAMLSALINLDQEKYTLLKAKQEMELAEAGIKLQSLRVAEAESGVGLARLQKGQSQAKSSHFRGLIAQGLLHKEKKALSQMAHARNLQHAAAAAHYTAATLHQIAAIKKKIFEPWKNVKGDALAQQANAISAFASGLSTTASAVSTNASILTTRANYERRAQEWQLQKNLADWDISIGSQQITVAQQRVGIVQQEKAIAELQLNHAQETIQFLANKFTNEELYEWMSRVLQDIYIYFLQQATATAKLAEGQLAFERQEYPPAIIQSDYRNLPLNKDNSGGRDNKYGLTGSFRLLRDITELDQYAFLNDTRKQLTVKTFSLAQLFPIEFQGLREDGVIVFSFSQEMFDRDFPGQYLRLIKRIRVSIVALIPPNEGVKATLTNPGISRTVIKGDTFQSTVIRRDPEVLVLSGTPIENTGFFELQPESSMYLPFENSGVATSFELRMPRPSNHFDFDSLADVLVTVEYNALFDFNYRQQVTQRLGRDFGAERSFSFQYDFSDQWYDLHNPEYSETPMQVSFRTQREHFPSNLSNIRIQHIAMYFVLQDEASPVEVTHFHFMGDGSVVPLGGSAATLDGLISTRIGNANSWTPILGLAPYGEWELNLSQLEEGEEDSLEEMELRRRFREGEIEDILFVISYEGVLPPWS